MGLPARAAIRRGAASALVLLLAGAGLPATRASAAGVAVSETVSVGRATSLAVQYRGNGHGHGLSQYGARGAARSGLSYGQILAFYYPGTRLTTMAHRIIRVKLSGTGTTTTIAAASGITVTGVSGYLPTTGIRRYRLIADARTGLTLQKLGTAAGSTWTNVRTGLANRAEFYRHGRVPLRLYLADGTSTEYDGYLRAVRATGGVSTINRVALDNYVAGVVPREMPASWEAAALDAQAVAARTYAASALGTGGAEYDICATSSCQVYGGRTHYAANGTVAWVQDAAPATATAYRILQYASRPAFTQFSASNGGWTVYGGQPYLAAKADPYDTAARSFDPYIGVSKTVTVASLAASFGLAKLTSVSITSRDGHGTWKGRVLAGVARGTDRAGAAKSVAVDGFDLQAAFGLGTTWLRIVPPAA